MHKLSDIAALTNLYSESKPEDRARAVKALEDNPELHQTMLNLGILGKEKMERTRDGRSLACTTKEMRDIAREAHRRSLNRQLKPAQFKLLDPRGTHILVPQFMHDKADGKPVEPHLRCHAHLKLLGKDKAVDRTIDVPMQFLRGHVDEEALIEKGIAMHAMDGETDKTPEDYGARYEEHYDISKLDDAEGKA